MDNTQQNNSLNENKQEFNTQQTQQYSNNNNMGVGNHPKFISTLIFAILELLCCNQITGIIALVLAIIGNSDWSKGRPLDADGKFKGANIALLVGALLGIIIYVAIFAIYGFGILAAIAGSM